MSRILAAYKKNFPNPFEWFDYATRLSINRVGYYQHYFKVSERLGPVWMRGPIDWNVYYGLWTLSLGGLVYTVFIMKKLAFGEVKKKPPRRPLREGRVYKHLELFWSPKFDR